MAPYPAITVLGASGLIGQAVAQALIRDGFPVTAVARRFTPAQAAAFRSRAVSCRVAELGADGLAALLAEHRADVVLNCIGVLQDSPRGGTRAIHQVFVEHLLEAIAAQRRPVLLIHLSVPGTDAGDTTAFSRTKREGERLIVSSGLPHVILRPGFVIAPAAFGGSALVRALAALPVRLPDELGARPFAATAVGDVARTVAGVAQAWSAGQRTWAAGWDIADTQRSTVASVVEAFRAHFGGLAPRIAVPRWALRLGAHAGDLAARLGWSPPVRTTALREMMRGVTCHPAEWAAATGLQPTSLEESLREVPATVQELLFARLFLLKPMLLATLVIFWIASGLIALTVAFDAAAAILTARGFALPLANGITAVSSLVDIAVGLAIAHRRTCRGGLLAGIAVSLFYMASAAVVTPAMWVEPLGALVKTGPAILLMLVALAILDER